MDSRKTNAPGANARNPTAQPTGRAKPGWLFVLPWSLRLVAGGGVNEVVKALIREFREGGVFEPHLLVSTEEPESGPTAGPEVIKPQCLNLWSPIDKEHPVRGLISFLYRLPYRCRKLRQIIKQHNIRVINPHFPGLGCLIFVILKKLGLFRGEIILSFHGSDVANAVHTTRVERRCWKALLRHTDGIVLVSKSLGAALGTIDGKITSKMKIVSNGVDFDLFGSCQQAREASPRARPTIVSVGAFLPVKGHDISVKAFSSVVKEIPNARLLLVGQDGPVFEELCILIEQLSLGDHVFLYRDMSHDQIPDFLAQAQLFVLASHREGHPLAVMEAGAAGLPVVCTRAIGSAELIMDRITGRTVEVGDEHGLARAMLDLLTQPTEAQQMAARFREYIRTHLTWKQAYEKYVRLAGAKSSAFNSLPRPASDD